MTTRTLVGIGCSLGLVAVFLFQKFDVVAWWGIHASNTTSFIINRSIRFLLNDALAIGLIFAIFYERKYLIFALVVQLVGLLIFLVPYFVFKVYYPAYNGPLISFLHRLVLNPTLMLLLIPAFYAQRNSSKQEHGQG